MDRHMAKFLENQLGSLDNVPDYILALLQNKPKTVTSTASLLSLNDDCLLHLYKYLDLAEFLSLQRTCKRLQSITFLAYKKLRDVTIEPETIQTTSIDFIFNHIGAYVQSLELNFSRSRSKNAKNILRKFEACKKVKILTIKSLSDNQDIPLPTCGYFQNIEMLTLNECMISGCISFFQCFRNLKSLNIYNCKNFGLFELASLLQYNPGIESLAFWSESTAIYDCSFKCIPKLKKLSLNTAFNAGIHSYNLAKLSLHILWNSKDLRKLNRNIEELELIIETRVEENFFDRLRLLSKLQLLYIRTLIPFKLIASLPKSDLKHLRLAGFEISSYSLISIIHQFAFIENIDLRDCNITKNDESFFSNTTKVAKEILKAMDICQFQQKLNVILPLPYFEQFAEIEERSRKYVFDSNRLRILNNRYYLCDEDPLGIGIDFHCL